MYILALLPGLVTVVSFYSVFKEQKLSAITQVSVRLDNYFVSHAPSSLNQRQIRKYKNMAICQSGTGNGRADRTPVFRVSISVDTNINQVDSCPGQPENIRVAAVIDAPL